MAAQTPNGDPDAQSPGWLDRLLPVFVPMGLPFQQMFGPSKTTQHHLIAKREITSHLVSVGSGRGRRMIDVQSYLQYVERQRQRELTGKLGNAEETRAARLTKAERQRLAKAKALDAAAAPPRAIECRQSSATTSRRRRTKMRAP